MLRGWQGVRQHRQEAARQDLRRIVGITEEGAEIMKEYKGSPALDAGLLAAAQASSITRFRATAL